MNIKVFLKPNSKKQKIEKIAENEFRVFVKSPAVENKANLELLELLGDYFKVSKSKIFILHGLKSKNKIINILDLPKLK
ncbi:MAG: DUF167 domain-containing protein [Candidatus Anstonellaceae archaeon]